MKKTKEKAILYPCFQCRETFKTEKDIQTHMAKVHKIEWKGIDKGTGEITEKSPISGRIWKDPGKFSINKNIVDKPVDKTVDHPLNQPFGQPRAQR